MVQCPWHGSRFDIRSGEVVRTPAMRPEPTYEIKVENNNILKNKKTLATSYLLLY
jgi:3-phenylpropionate/trans-cinnamate dioxygenase ferredoxin component